MKLVTTTLENKEQYKCKGKACFASEEKLETYFKLSQQLAQYWDGRL